MLTFSNCSNFGKDKKYDLIIKYKFINRECAEVSRCLCEMNDISKIPKVGVFGNDIFTTSVYSDVILHDNILIDPFIKGEKRVTVKNFKERREDNIFRPVPTEITLGGAPLSYVFDKEIIFLLLLFGGPDCDYDINISDISLDNIYNGNKGYIYSHYIDIPQFIHYDPTNGIISNGDIAVLIYEYNRRSYKVYQDKVLEAVASGNHINYNELFPIE
jgi:hypothetical protein